MAKTDGNFVVYNSSGAPVWHAGGYGNPGAYLSIRDDGALIVRATSCGSAELVQTAKGA